MPTDELFGPIVTTDELLAATGDQAWLAALLDAEAALARAEARVGVIPAAAAEAIAAACQPDGFDAAQLGRAARGGGNPVIPLVARLADTIAPEGRDFVHWGATSQDIIDTAAVLVARRAGALIGSELDRLAAACAALAERHRGTVMTGRTLLQPALPITFGLKAAGWLAGVTDCRRTLRAALSGLAVQLGGAAGTLASLDPDGPAVLAAYAAELDLPEPVIPWHTTRQKMAALAGALGTAAGTAAKISGDVALMMQQEVGEAFEPAGPGRGGSSTLPGKRNPVGAAAVGAAARRAIALIGLYYEGLAGEHERHVTAWPVEWQTLGDLLALAGGAVARTAETVEGLEVDAPAMAERVERSAGILLGERITLILARRMGRSAARSAVSEAGRKAVDSSAAAFARSLMADPGVVAVLPADELGELLDPIGYLGASDTWIDRALADHARGGPVTDRAIRVDGPPGAPVLVLSNSLGTTADMWEPQMAPLAARFRVVRYEHRGHGGTDAPAGPYSIEDLGGDLLAVLDAVGVHRASVMGLSLGGNAAMWLAIHHPERVDRLVLSCTAPSWPPRELWQERVRLVQAGGPAALVDALSARWFTPGYLKGHPDAGRALATMLEACSSDGYAGYCAALAELDLTEGVASIAAPTLVLAGASDPAVPIRTAAALAASLPDAGLQVIARGAHLVNVEQAERFNAAVLEHLAGNPVERGRAVRRAVLGDAHVDRSERVVDRMTTPFSDLLTRYAWGDVWTRPGLDRRTRSCITMAMLVAVGRFDELELHLVGARRNGLSDAEIGEVLLQTAIYCGVPAANAAFGVARRVLDAGGDPSEPPT